MNVELAERIVAKIDENPRLWQQAAWMGDNECGTTHCIAGWACALEADKVEWDNPYGIREPVDGWEEEGQRLLDLTNDQVTALFYGNMNNDREELILTLKRIEAGEI